MNETSSNPLTISGESALPETEQLRSVQLQAAKDLDLIQQLSSALRWYQLRAETMAIAFSSGTESQIFSCAMGIAADAGLRAHVLHRIPKEWRGV